MFDRKSSQFVSKAANAVLAILVASLHLPLFAQELGARWISKNSRELVFSFQLHELINECIQISRSMEINLEYQLCKTGNADKRAANAENANRRSRRQKPGELLCSKPLQLTRGLRISLDSDKVKLSQDVLGDKLPGVTYFYSDLAEATKDFTANFALKIPREFDQIKAKLMFKCSKAGSQRLSKFLSFLTGKDYFKKHFGEKIFKLE